MSEAQTLSQKLIAGKEVTKIVGFGRTKLNLLVKAGKFPQPIRFSDNFIRWDLEEVNAWIEQQKAMRGA
ncbi:AlpA family phage regulatory protein [Pasteurella multocida]|uniref:Helix-turn-helix transcriptional regulator n=1 Tax=Pasteurella oralis TaxID=1071947 RepID=A0ABW4NTZ0_9PAST|nr:AlpA family phage regulatory protein [Pasteurella multocida]MEB3477027.1 AlpA family phage regulatory protein [Pasteurella multocida]MEB3508356.1 AlpA family phage regulatory protein [Pasteurella multocida]WRJ98860.1 AlpA family phage regulatory protein [Pasteurella multocida]HDR1105188.1 AlpA family phage regulatory protein [Pasteurella multocida]HEP1081830.1 AlpA family phage regulatory protein [Pasteurella multocida]